MSASKPNISLMESFLLKISKSLLYSGSLSIPLTLAPERLVGLLAILKRSK